MKLSAYTIICSSLLLAGAHAFTTAPSINIPSSCRPQQVLRSSSSSETTDAVVDEQDPLGLTPELRRLTDAFQNIGDDKLRYKQLLYMASNGLDPMPEELKVEENKVLGCLSTVHVHATTNPGEDEETLVKFTGDSDGLLTKGLVALLVRGLSGNTAEDIQKVDPSFIQTAGISQSLTPGRNNGFLNMLALMKQKALEASEAPATATSSGDAEEAEAEEGDSGDHPIYDAIVTALQALQPTKLELIDNSQQNGGGKESHFDLVIVADAFEGLNIIKRQQLVYMMLGEVMPQIESLQIQQAMTPDEAGQ